MRFDRFMTDIGLAKVSTEQLEKVEHTLVRMAEEFLSVARYGMSWELWRDLSPVSKDAFLVAAERLRAEDLVRMGRMIGASPEAILFEQSALDGGEEAEEYVLGLGVHGLSEHLTKRMV